MDIRCITNQIALTRKRIEKLGILCSLISLVFAIGNAFQILKVIWIDFPIGRMFAYCRTQRTWKNMQQFTRITSETASYTHIKYRFGVHTLSKWQFSLHVTLLCGSIALIHSFGQCIIYHNVICSHVYGAVCNWTKKRWCELFYALL